MDYTMHDIYEWMVVTVARLGRQLPDVDLALREAIGHLAGAIPFVEAPDGDGALTRAAAHQAFVSVVALGQHLVGAREDGVRDTEIAYRAVLAVLDALDPHVGPADRALRSVLPGGELLAPPRRACG